MKNSFCAYYSPSSRWHLLLLSAVLLWLASPLYAQKSKKSDLNYAQVTKVAVERRGTKAAPLWDIHVSVRHNDQGWDHYADLWEGVGSDGKVLFQRILAHPHDNEQPFTRSLYSQKVSTQKSFRIRASCKKHGAGGQTVRVQLQNKAGRQIFQP